MQLVIDIGNSQTVFGCKLDDWVTQRASTMWGDADELAIEIESALTTFGLTLLDIDSVGVSSVVPDVDSMLIEAVQKLLSFEPTFVRVDVYPYPISYGRPAEIGADRLADAAGALAKYLTPLIVVDFGTATTFDYLNNERAYCGGPILPGILLSKRALSAAAAKLPSVDFARVDNLLPKTTVEAMQAGLFYGSVGAVDKILQLLLQEVGEVKSMIATGGLASQIVPSLEHALTIDPYLTMDGIAALTTK